MNRAGEKLGTVPSTPGSVHVDKSKSDLTINCSKDGYQNATVSKSSHFAGTTFGNIAFGGLIGVVADAASGAMFAYPDEVKIDPATAKSATQDKVSAATPSSNTSPVVQPVAYRPTSGTSAASVGQ